MKNLHSRFVIFLLFVCFNISCTDQQELQHDIDSDSKSFNRWDDAGSIAPRYDGSDGGPIANEFGRVWIENFLIKSHKKNARITEGDYFVTRDIIDRILLQPGCTGIRIYYAISENEPILIISGVDANGVNLLGENPILAVSSYSFSNATNSIDVNLAQGFINNYQMRVASTEILSHYFGRNVIDIVLKQNNCTGLHLYIGLNEAGDQKILIAGTSSVPTVAGLSGRNMSEPDLPLLMNFSFPCPSVCGNHSNGL